MSTSEIKSMECVGDMIFCEVSASLTADEVVKKAGFSGFLTSVLATNVAKGVKRMVIQLQPIGSTTPCY